MCKSVPNLVMRHDSGAYSVGSPDCRCWSCSECEKKLRQKWIDAFGEGARSDKWQVARFRLGNEWNAYRKRLRYWDCAWLKLKDGDEFVVVHEALPSTARHKQDAASMITTESAKQLVSEKGRTADRISCGMNFPRPQSWREKKEHPGWEYMTQTKMSIDELNRVLAAHGAAPVSPFKRIRGRSAQIVHMTLCPWNTDQCLFQSSAKIQNDIRSRFDSDRSVTELDLSFFSTDLTIQAG